MDKQLEKGFTREVVSTDRKHMNPEPFVGVDTLYKAILRNAERIPDHKLIGTRVGDRYEWISV